MSRPNGFTVWRGPSRINGEPIRAVVVGTFRPTTNRKTGPGDQVYIFPDVSYVWGEVKNGRAVSVCGDCPMWEGGQRSLGFPEVVGRTCYPTPLSLISAGKDVYPDREVEQLPEAFGLRRLGAWGDPAAIPTEVNLRLIATANRHTGFTRRWRVLGEAPEREFLMASCYTLAEVRDAEALGWRCYYVSAKDEPLAAGLMWCPHLTRGIQCAQCKLCGGASGARSIQNPVHGSRAGKFPLIRRYLDKLREEI